MSAADVLGPRPTIPGNQPANLGQATAKVAELIRKGLGPDHSPDIDGATISLYYEANKNTAFVDKDAYSLGVSRFLEEAERQAKLDGLLSEGNDLAAMMYTWRCCSLAVPPVKSQAQENRMDIYNSVVEVLEPEIAKLKHLREFHERAADQFCVEVDRLCKDPSTFVSEAYLLSLGKMINMFAALNELKNIKASIKNDFTQYKRAAEICKKLSGHDEISAAQKLSMFLATNDSIMSEVKSRIQKISKHEELLADIVNTCVQMLENDQYMVPSEKQGMIKVIGFCLFLIDSKEVNINTHKKLKLNRVDKLFKRVEAVPLFGDMMIGPIKFIEKTPNYDPSKWPNCISEKASSQSELLKLMPQLREEYKNLLSDLVTHGTNLLFYNAVYRKKQIPAADNKTYFDLALRTLRMLSAWTSRITELFSWKLLHPTSHEDKGSGCPPEAEEYEKATRYNYKAEEKTAMTEVIAMVKSVQKQVLKMDRQFSECINRHVYTELQEFVQVALREPLRKAIKHKKKEQLLVTLNSIRNLCSDVMADISPDKDPLYKGRKDADSGFKVQIGVKNVPPSSTQLYMLRTMLESLVDKSGKKKSLRNDLDQNHIAPIEAFLKTSFFWHYMIDFSNTLCGCCDLSQFWYREFYLEMTLGKRIQFPIEMSMPWILTDHIIETRDPALMEYILYPMDLYNDSAHSALHIFKKQHLYEEIEAEVDLCFDQLVFKLSDQIFEHYKRMAGVMYLDRTFKEKLSREFKLESKIPKVPKMRYVTLMKQQHVSILGRQVDLKRLLGQRLNIAFVKALELAIGRFESKDITGIMELDGLLEVNRLAHRLLSQHVELETFDALFNEANKSVTAPYGKICLKIFLEVNMDFTNQYCYNGTTNRYVRTKLSFADEVPEREKAPHAAQAYLWGGKSLTQCYTPIYNHYSKFVGTPHFDAMVKWIGYQEVALIFTELLNTTKSTINNALLPYFGALQRVFPDRCILPRFEMTSTGVLRYFQDQLEPIITYGDLQSKLFQYLRVVGNSVLFLMHLEQALSRKEVQELKGANLFLNIIPKPFLQPKEGEEKEARSARLKSAMNKLLEKYSSCLVVPVIDKHGNAEQKQTSVEGAVLTREKLCCGLTVFEMVLTKLKASLDPTDTVWTGPKLPNGVLEVNYSKELHRIWSALQFVYCLPVGQHQFSAEELFGEGLQWAGCTLMVLLEQNHRFEAMDFGYHLIKVHKIDNKDEQSKGVSVRKMVDRLRKFQILNDEIFSILSKYMNRPTKENFHPAKYSSVIHHCDPPRHENTSTDAATKSAETGGDNSPTTSSSASIRRVKKNSSSGGGGGAPVRDSIDLVSQDFEEEDRHTDA